MSFWTFSDIFLQDLWMKGNYFDIENCWGFDKIKTKLKYAEPYTSPILPVYFLLTPLIAHVSFSVNKYGPVLQCLLYRASWSYQINCQAQLQLVISVELALLSLFPSTSCRPTYPKPDPATWRSIKTAFYSKTYFVTLVVQV